MKRPLLLAVLAASGATAFAQVPAPMPPGAGPLPPAFVDHARVRSTEPQYEQVQIPRQSCTTQTVVEQRPVAQPTSVGGTLLGAVVGGLVGNQVGRGHGKEAATAAGAVAGALVGNNIANGQQPQEYAQVPQQVQTCQQVNEVQNRLVGYRVTYEYRGHEYVTVLRNDPGPELPVRVSVTPVEGEYHRRY
jgi:uncharacterized protein YcfJ